MVEALRSWLSANRPVVLFVYGLVFFTLGVAIVMQSRRYSRLRLARSLPWLAGFGFLHAMNEWGDLFIPIQRTYLSSPMIELLRAGQNVVLAVSFTSLMQFGITLLQPSNRRLRTLAAPALFVLWAIVTFWVGMPLVSDVNAWHDWAEALARYLLCIPAGVVAAVGLLHQRREQIGPLRVPTVNRALITAAVALLIYSFLGGAIVPPVRMYPALLLNTRTITTAILLPPAILRSLAGLALAVSMIRMLDIFNIETDWLIRKMEETEVLSIERERIARDLHDGVLQQAYSVGLFSESIARRIGPRYHDLTKRLVLAANQLIDELRCYLPRLQPKLEGLQLVPALMNVVSELANTLPIETYFGENDDLILTARQVSHLTAFAREALSNAVRHADTSKVELHLEFEEGSLRLLIRDYGRGLPKDIDVGYGLRNMRDRARLLGAVLRFDSRPLEGTSVILDVPLENTGETYPGDDCR